LFGGRKEECDKNVNKMKSNITLLQGKFWVSRQYVFTVLLSKLRFCIGS
jgi:hypothetical protein